MNNFFKLVVASLLLTLTQAETGDVCSNENCTTVINHAFCGTDLPSEAKEVMKSLRDVHTYAELKNDLSSSLPDKFTICSTIMPTSCTSVNYPLFFNILDNNLGSLMGAWLSISIESEMGIDASTWSTSARPGIPPTFPYQWTRSCMAIDRTYGSIDWVIEGNQVLKSKNVTDLKKIPKNLSNKLVLGASSYGEDWYAQSNKVTNVNIFSSTLPTEEMKTMTQGPDLAKDGDYLAWRDMEWILHGHT